MKSPEWPRVLSHSGFQAIAPPNSLLAFDLAARAGAAGIEIDVRQSRDGEFFLWHDDSLAPRIPMPGGIMDLTAAQLRTLDATPPSSATYRHPLGKTPIASLADAFALAARWDLELHLDFKQGSPEDLLAAISRAGVTDLVTVEAFDLTLLRQVHSAAPHLRLGRISMDPLDLENYEGPPLFMASLWYEMVLANPDQARRALERGLQLNIWTVNDHESWTTCHAWGAHSIMTDDPAGCLAVGAALQGADGRARVADRQNT